MAMRLGRKTRANLFIVGAPKCGTTAWWHYLSQHPQVFMSPAKEPHFFSTDFPNFRWAKSRDDYERLFMRSEKFSIRGEASVMYLYSEVAAEGIRAYNSEARIVICLRRHRDFLRSYHGQLRLNLDEDEPDLVRALELEPIRREGRRIPRGCREPRFLFYSDVARFAPQVERFLRLFPKEQVCVLQLEEWTKAPKEAWIAVQDFLNLDRFDEVDLDVVNEARDARSMHLSRLYRSPTAPAKIVARGLRALGVDTGKVAHGLRRFNERSKGATATASLNLHDSWIKRIQSDESQLNLLLSQANTFSI